MDLWRVTIISRFNVIWLAQNHSLRSYLVVPIACVVRFINSDILEDNELQYEHVFNFISELLVLTYLKVNLCYKPTLWILEVFWCPFYSKWIKENTNGAAKVFQVLLVVWGFPSSTGCFPMFLCYFLWCLFSI